MYLKNNIFLLCLIVLSSCNLSKHKYDDVVFSKDEIYLFYRETPSKVGEISKSYNINNSNYSHIGIGFLDTKNNIKIYHIIPNKKPNSKNDLLCESLKDFFEPKDEEIKSGGILKINNLVKKSQIKIIKQINEISKKNLKFDTNFENFDDNNFYCSEFVCKILTKSNKEQFNFSLTKKAIYGLDSSYLGKDTIEYYPVDIFLNKKEYTTLLKF